MLCLQEVNIPQKNIRIQFEGENTEIPNSTCYNNSRYMSDSPWPMFMNNPNHTGMIPIDTSNNPGRLKWKSQITWRDNVISSPAIDRNGTIYIGSGYRNLYAIDQNGNEKWVFPSNSSVYSSPAIGINGTIYFGSDDRYIYAVNPNGTLKWKYRTGGDVSSSPCIGGDGRIYVGSDDGFLYSMYPNGSLNWKYETGHFIISSPLINENGLIYFGSGESLYALRLNGSLMWKYQTMDDIYSSPSIDSNGIIYIGSRDDNLYAIYPNGTKKWHFHTNGSIDSSPGIGNDGTVYIGSGDNYYYAITPAGIEKWKFKTHNSIWRSSPAIDINGISYFGSTDSHFYSIYPNGTLRWQYYVEDHIWSSPAIDKNGTIYFGAHNGYLYSLTNCTSHPSPPLNVSYRYGDGYVNLSWKIPQDDGGDDIIQYLIYRGYTSHMNFYQSTAIPMIYFNDTHVINGYDYCYYITALNSIGESTPSNTICTCPLGHPTPPRNLYGFGENGYVELYWETPDDTKGAKLTNYEINRNRGDTEEGNIVRTVSCDTLNYKDTGVINGQLYYYYIVAYNMEGASKKSNVINVTPKGFPSIPLNLNTTFGYDYIKISWESPVDNGGSPILEYNIYRGIKSGIWGPIDTVQSFETEYNDTSISNDQRYYYVVTAVNGIGESNRSNEIVVVPFLKPKPPIDLISISSDDYLHIYWQVPDHNGGTAIWKYNVYRSSLSELSHLIECVNASIHTYCDKDIQYGIQYSYYVTATNLVGESNPSNYINETKFKYPSPPTNITISIFNDYLHFKWESPKDNGGSNIVQYDIYRYVTSGNWIVFAQTKGNITFYNCANTFANSHFYYMTAINLHGESMPSTIVIVEDNKSKNIGNMNPEDFIGFVDNTDDYNKISTENDTNNSDEIPETEKKNDIFNIVIRGFIFLGVLIIIGRFIFIQYKKRNNRNVEDTRDKKLYDNIRNLFNYKEKK